MAKGKRWTRDELFLAMNLYTKLSFGQFYAGNETIQETAALMGRTPSSLAMKLCNLASLDPAHQNRSVTGLRNASKLDKQVWQEFQSHWSDCLLTSEELWQKFHNEEIETVDKSGDRLAKHPEITETWRLKKQRRGQQLFRGMVLSAYNSRCAMTGNPIPELLVASHIVPWKDNAQERLNPANGICLSRNYDAAFDRGLITFDEHYCLKVSEVVKDFLPDPIIIRDFIDYEGCSLQLPDKFPPQQDFLSVHRQTIFQS